MKLSIPFISATAIAFSTGVTMAQDLSEPPTLPTFEFNHSAPSTCDQDINIDYDGLTTAQRTLYHRAAIIGCELFKAEAEHPNFLNQQVSMLQNEIIIVLEEHDVETSTTDDGILGPFTAEAFVDYAMVLNVYEVFSSELMSQMGANGLHIAKFINELETHAPTVIALARSWATEQHTDELQELQDMRDELLERKAPTPVNSPIPACEDKLSTNIHFEGTCYYDANLSRSLRFG